MEKLYTSEEVAERYGVHVKTVRRWVRAGKLRARHLGTFRLRISEEHLAEFDKDAEIAHPIVETN